MAFRADLIKLPPKVKPADLSTWARIRHAMINTSRLALLGLEPQLIGKFVTDAYVDEVVKFLQEIEEKHPFAQGMRSPSCILTRAVALGNHHLRNRLHRDDVVSALKRAQTQLYISAATEGIDPAVLEDMQRTQTIFSHLSQCDQCGEEKPLQVCK